LGGKKQYNKAVFSPKGLRDTDLSWSEKNLTDSRASSSSSSALVYPKNERKAAK